MKASDFDGVTERLVGWGCMIGAAAEVVAPAFLAIDLATAGGLGTFGFLVATGRAEAAVRKIGRILAGE